MIDAIEMLEAIGSDASLRYASSTELTKVLREAQAPEALTTAIISGDTSGLLQGSGNTRMFVPQATQYFFAANQD